MINWRSGLAGFVGGSKRFIKGVFQPSYTATSVTVDAPEIIDGIISTITGDGFGITGLITADGNGILSTMSDDGIISTMTSDGFGVFSAMSADGDGIISTQ